jgi:hypothetical protein
MKYGPFQDFQTARPYFKMMTIPFRYTLQERHYLFCSIIVHTLKQRNHLLKHLLQNDLIISIGFEDITITPDFRKVFKLEYEQYEQQERNIT